MFNKKPTFSEITTYVTDIEKASTLLDKMIFRKYDQKLIENQVRVVNAMQVALIKISERAGK